MDDKEKFYTILTIGTIVFLTLMQDAWFVSQVGKTIYWTQCFCQDAIYDSLNYIFNESIFKTAVPTKFVCKTYFLERFFDFDFLYTLDLITPSSLDLLASVQQIAMEENVNPLSLDELSREELIRLIKTNPTVSMYLDRQIGQLYYTILDNRHEIWKYLVLKDQRPEDGGFSVKHDEYDE